MNCHVFLAAPARRKPDVPEKRTVILATAANEAIARAVAYHFGLFDTVVASTAEDNLRGTRKRDRLQEEFGAAGFDYIGDSAADLPIWEACRQAIVVADSESGLVKRARQANGNCRTIPAGRGGLKAYTSQIRVHQWVKNSLIAIPMIFTRHFEPPIVVTVFLGMLCFSFMSSLIYVINDLADLRSDRMHLQKRTRPFAAGTIPLWSGPLLLFLLAAALLLTASVLPRGVWPIMAVYFFLNLSYSWVLKRVLMLDVVILMMFYVLRIMAGDVLIGMPHSNWMIGFGCFVFLGLSLIKRVTELLLYEKTGARQAHGRAYRSEDRGILTSMAVACGFSSLTILALYIDSLQATRVFIHPHFLWLLCPLICYWYGRVLIITNRGNMHGDPVRFVLVDPVSILTMCLGVVCVFLAAVKFYP